MYRDKKSVLIYSECPACGNDTLWCNYSIGSKGYEHQCLDCDYEDSHKNEFGCYEQRKDYEKYRKSMPSDQ